MSFAELDPSRADVDGNDGWMTAVQVAEALGVKRATVYAYVSRGLLHRRLALDGRTSLFDRTEVDHLRQGRRGTPSGELRTVLATAITGVGDGTLIVRGHDLVTIITAGAGFEEIADLIWQADSDSSGRGSAWQPATVSPHGSTAVGEPDHVTFSALDRFRIAVTTTAAADPLRGNLTPAVVRRTAPRLIRAMIESLPPVGDPVGDQDGDEVSSRTPISSPHMPTARLLWPRLTTAPANPDRVRALDIALALLADHGLASSTFAVRVAASVRADPYAVVGAGLGALDGPLHGAASADVHRSLAAVAGGGDGLEPLARRASSEPAGVPGFGHTVYRSVDPRFSVLRDAVQSAWAEDDRRTTLADYHNAVSARTDGPANVDLALGYLTFMAGTAPEAGETIFAVARCAGWLGHAMEEYEERPLRLRPKGHYVGPLPLAGESR